MGRAGFHQGEGDPALSASQHGGGGLFGWGGGTDTRVLQRHNLRVSYNGKPVDASQVDWQSVDIRRFTFIQPAGPTNVLGGIKFRFPNKHDIYMHDTPQRDLFEKTVRAYSHGCIRVQNPGRLAEILLEEDKGWSAAHVRNLLAQGGNNEVTLTKQIPVHITYFTVMVGDDGRLQSFGDLYGHDNRVAVGAWRAGRCRWRRRPLRLRPVKDPQGSAARQGPQADQQRFLRRSVRELERRGAWPCRRIGCQATGHLPLRLLLSSRFPAAGRCRRGPPRRFAYWRQARFRAPCCGLSPL